MQSCHVLEHTTAWYMESFLSLGANRSMDTRTACNCPWPIKRMRSSTLCIRHCMCSLSLVLFLPCAKFLWIVTGVSAKAFSNKYFINLCQKHCSIDKEVVSFSYNLQFLTFWLNCKHCSAIPLQLTHLCNEVFWMSWALCYEGFWQWLLALTNGFRITPYFLGHRTCP